MKSMKQRGTWQFLATAAVLASTLLAAPAAWASDPVKMVNAGFGLSGGGGGPVVNLAVDPSQIQVRVSGVCASGFAMRAIAGDGTVTCVPVGTITAVNAGAGLTGGGSSGAVTLGVTNGGITNAMLANPALSVLAGTGLSGGGSVALGASTTLGIANSGVDTAQLAAGAVTTGKLSASGSSAGQVLTSDGTNVSWQSPSAANAWSLSGNAGTDPSTNFLGTTDNVPLELKVNGGRALRLEPGPSSPNLIGGFRGNFDVAGSRGATIGGGGDAGFPNSVSAGFGTVAGGLGNTASGFGASVAGGSGNNTASGTAASVAGGGGNIASGAYASVAGGLFNTASGTYASVAGGLSNTASGNGSFAAGQNAKATDVGSFVWADLKPQDFPSNGTNTFSVRSTGGARFVSAIDGSGNPSAGVSLAAGGGSWTSLSDRAAKKEIVPLDSASVLRRLAGLPVFVWSYKAQPASIRHLGPMAQDFAKAFHVGETTRGIDDVDAQGVSLAAIKGLYALTLKQQRQLNTQQREIRALQRALHVRQAR